MLIILEGPDGAGKTRLAQRLIERIKAAQPGAPEPEYIHKKTPTETSFLAEYLQPIADYRPRTDRTLILDRWHLGELIYPEMTDRQTLATAVEFRYLEMFLKSRGAVVVHVTTEPTAILQSLTERPEHDSLEYRVLEQHAAFGRALKTTSVRSITYDRTQDANTSTSLDLIIAHACAAELDTPRIDINPTYVGAVRPAVVLIGDRRNVRKDSFEYDTAFVPESATSGHFLMNALPKYWLKYCTVGFLNANEGYPVKIFPDAPVQPRYVVLGREAEKTLRETAELEYFGVVPHPQYVRRFHHHARDSYGSMIQNVSMSMEDQSTWRP